MFNLANISVKDFFQLEEQNVVKYVELQSIMKSKPMFLKNKAKELGSLPFGEVVSLKNYLSNPTYESLLESFKMVFGIKQNEYLNADVVSFFYALNHIRESVIKLIKSEAQLNTEPDADLEMAGVRKLSVFGEMAVLINLGEKFGKAPTEIAKWKYGIVINTLKYYKVKGEVQKKYMELKSKKTNGRKG